MGTLDVLSLSHHSLEKISESEFWVNYSRFISIYFSTLKIPEYRLY